MAIPAFKLVNLPTGSHSYRLYDTDGNHLSYDDEQAIVAHINKIGEVQPRRCDCESSHCKVDHPIAGCTNNGTVQTIHSKICEACAAYMPQQYLVPAKK
jgi:hypothetical protein